MQADERFHPWEARGVYIAPHRHAGGGNTMYAVDRRGVRVASVDYPVAEMDPDEVAAMYNGARDLLAQLLDTVDPDRTPALGLVR